MLLIFSGAMIGVFVSTSRDETGAPAVELALPNLNERSADCGCQTVVQLIASSR
jgi:hypothetical protein